ncbi:autotransporter assembly complex protein TamA [Thetidibacter halocola]|uniref:Outer membrane protein assembly factor n=1 Tax=Thetidibacter halocola TaxID=2827239 RepID=A0A8J7WJG7_9RHOB|nr:autotransporter assembly complex family protein [Thetidibacter halocola]MBS0126193.1 outer membrane protein assembly factor [Thetidibacter halocola]
MTKRAWAAALLLALATPATALDRVDLRLSQDDEDLSTALKGASLLRALRDDGDGDAADALAAAQADYARLLEVLYAEGHYGAAISIKLDGREAALIPPLNPPSAIRDAVISIDPGPVYALAQTRVAPLAPGSTLPEGFAPGAPARADIVRGAAQGAVTDWRQYGHAKARIADQAITARHDADTLDVNVAIDPGRQATFGEVGVQGETAVREPRVRQIAGIPRGDRFDPEAVTKAAERLRKTGTFRSVTIAEAETIAPDGTLDMEITVVDRPPRRISGGVELSSLEGLTLSADWLHRNILGGAERLLLRGEITQIGGGSGGPDLTLGARFEKPAVYGPDTLFFALAEAHYTDEPDYLDEGGKIGLGVTREFSDTLSADIGISLAYSNITDRYLGRDADGNYPNRELLLFGLPTALTWDRRDNTLDATKGFYIRAEVEPFAYLLGTGNGGARLALDARGYRGLGSSDRLVLAGRLQLGALVGPDAADAPPDYLFYSGGGGTVRGQPFQSLDADYNGTRLGGRGFAGTSLELRAGITDKISVVGFADAGYISADSSFASGDWHAGAGIGLRYDTTIGPIRVDLAGPVAGTTGDGVQLYIGIGQAF